MADSSLDNKGVRSKPLRQLERPVDKLVLLVKAEDTESVPDEEP